MNYALSPDSLYLVNQEFILIASFLFSFQSFVSEYTWVWNVTFILGIKDEFLPREFIKARALFSLCLNTRYSGWIFWVRCRGVLGLLGLVNNRRTNTWMFCKRSFRKFPLPSSAVLLPSNHQTWMQWQAGPGKNWVLFIFLLYKRHRFRHHLYYPAITMPTFKYKIRHSHNEEILILDQSQQPWLLHKLWEALGSFADRQAVGGRFQTCLLTRQV